MKSEGGSVEKGMEAKVRRFLKEAGSFPESEAETGNRKTLKSSQKRPSEGHTATLISTPEWQVETKKQADLWCQEGNLKVGLIPLCGTPYWLLSCSWLSQKLTSLDQSKMRVESGPSGHSSGLLTLPEHVIH